LGVEPTKKLWKARNISFCGWILCIIRLYPTTTSTTKAKPNTSLNHTCNTLVTSCHIHIKYYTYDVKEWWIQCAYKQDKHGHFNGGGNVSPWNYYFLLFSFNFTPILSCVIFGVFFLSFLIGYRSFWLNHGWLTKFVVLSLLLCILYTSSWEFFVIASNSTRNIVEISSLHWRSVSPNCQLAEVFALDHREGKVSRFRID
jgi:hypothetical protein